MDVKRCFKCGIEKDVEAFYRHPAMADGRLGKCKDCTRADVTANRGERLDAVRAYDRQRAVLPHRKAAIDKTVRAWRAKHPGRSAAHSAVARAVKDGRLVRPATCQRAGCQTGLRPEAHHDDYADQLRVTWVCKPCHALVDRERREREGCAL